MKYLSNTSKNIFQTRLSLKNFQNFLTGLQWLNLPHSLQVMGFTSQTRMFLIQISPNISATSCPAASQMLIFGGSKNIFASFWRSHERERRGQEPLQKRRVSLLTDSKQSSAANEVHASFNQWNQSFRELFGSNFNVSVSCLGTYTHYAYTTTLI